MAYEAHFAGAPLTESLLTGGEDLEKAAYSSLQRQPATVIAFVGMNFEAKIAAGPGALVFCRNSRSELAAAANDAARLGYRGIISFGVAGGLASNLRPGDWVVASAIVEADATHATDAVWSSRLRDAIKGCSYAPIVGSDIPIAEPATKRTLHRTTGAVAVDMESHVVARVAAAYALAFTALRVVVDPADRAIPPAALMGMGSGPRSDGAAVLRDLVARPSQLPLLIRVSLDAFIARAQMQRVRRLLGPHFGLTEFDRQEAAEPIAREDDLVQAATAPYHAPA
jgi:adenosylhomocysteine nucleosidase